MQLIIKEDKLQRYRDHVQAGTSLSEKDKELFDRYFFAFTNLLDGLSERKAVELLMNCPAPLGQLSQSQAYNVVNGAQEIFGVLNFSSSKKMAQRYIYATRLEEMAGKVEELARTMVNNSTKLYYDEDGRPVSVADPAAEKEAAVMFEKASNILMKAGKIKGLTEKDKIENPNKFKVSPNIIFTDDLDALDLLREIEDGSYEDVTGNGRETEEDQAETAGK
ncbi:hypothetical protein [Dyadobacter diqingensis]|uniref:hypothetical protein n=1 Tax=Dyadobacter diqingensis TaxID=2938121 RepID=UPI0020C545CF|nr:hypothetical protein [Dyadobacter diqingensis]